MTTTTATASSGRSTEAGTLGNSEVAATIAVKDLKAAGRFYEGTLGLEAVPSGESEVLTYKCADSKVLVYRSQFAGTNKATSATWTVDDVEGVVSELKEKGVAFEHYDLPGLTLKGDIHVAENFKSAWLKDPDGNILAIVGR
jgi:catechol 2,3-dioxygenase-like lactoylglutathione lyase family enzyme